MYIGLHAAAAAPAGAAAGSGSRHGQAKHQDLRTAHKSYEWHYVVAAHRPNCAESLTFLSWQVEALPAIGMARHALNAGEPSITVLVLLLGLLSAFQRVWLTNQGRLAVNAPWLTRLALGPQGGVALHECRVACKPRAAVVLGFACSSDGIVAKLHTVRFKLGEQCGGTSCDLHC
jgi:hypothetical protein